MDIDYDSKRQDGKHSYCIFIRCKNLPLNLNITYVAIGGAKGAVAGASDGAENKDEVDLATKRTKRTKRGRWSDDGKLGR
eukprot:1318112-Pleurochrysis_carterae.AAC.1